MVTSTAPITSNAVAQATIGFRDQVDIIKANYFIGQDRRGGKAIPLFFWGLPGVGKSVAFVQAGKEIAEYVGRKFILNPPPALLHSEEILDYFFIIDHRLAQELPVDAKGLVAPHHQFPGKMGWLTPVHIPTDIAGIMGILFYDELPQAPKSVQSAYFQIVHDRVAGEVPIPAGVMQCAAGNPPEALGDYNHPGPALANRFVHYNMHCNFDEWFTWGAELNARTGTTNIDPTILTFHQFHKGKYLHNFDPEREDSLAYATPRSWEFASDLMGMPPQHLYNTLIGAVGHTAAIQLHTYLAVLKDLPDPLDILERGIMHHPTDLGQQYALIGAILNNLEAKHAKNFVKYLDGLRGELATMAVKLAFKMDKGYFETDPNFLKWLLKNHHLTV